MHPFLASVGQPVAVRVGQIGEAEETGLDRRGGGGRDDVRDQHARIVGGLDDVRHGGGAFGRFRRRGERVARHGKVSRAGRGIDRHPEEVRPCGRFEDINVKGFKRSRTRVEFPESRATDYKISVFNGDNLPLENISVKGSGPGYYAGFIDTRSPALTLYYGGKAPVPVYDLAAVTSHLANPARVEYIPGKEQHNPLYRPEGWKFDGNSVFILAIVLLAFILGLILVRNIRHLKMETPEDDKDGS